MRAGRVCAPYDTTFNCSWNRFSNAPPFAHMACSHRRRGQDKTVSAVWTSRYGTSNQFWLVSQAPRAVIRWRRTAAARRLGSTTAENSRGWCRACKTPTRHWWADGVLGWSSIRRTRCLIRRPRATTCRPSSQSPSASVRVRTCECLSRTATVPATIDHPTSLLTSLLRDLTTGLCR